MLHICTNVNACVCVCLWFACISVLLFLFSPNNETTQFIIINLIAAPYHVHFPAPQNIFNRQVDRICLQTSRITDTRNHNTSLISRSVLLFNNRIVHFHDQLKKKICADSSHRRSLRQNFVLTYSIFCHNLNSNRKRVQHIPGPFCTKFFSI